MVADRSSTWPTRIVVGVDTSPESIAALERALRLATSTGAAVEVVHAVGLLEQGAFRPHPDLQGIVDEACARVDCSPDAVAGAVMEDGPPSIALLRVAERSGADLLVVGRRGLGGTLRSLGSTSEAVLDQSSIPVLVVPLGG